MAKLNQIIAVEKGVKSKAHQDLTAAQHGLQKPALLAGISRTYQPKDEEGEQRRVHGQGGWAYVSTRRLTMAITASAVQTVLDHLLAGGALPPELLSRPLRQRHHFLALTPDDGAEYLAWPSADQSRAVYLLQTDPVPPVPSAGPPTHLEEVTR